jgi:chloramphenicol-sensitive protein RarD
MPLDGAPVGGAEVRQHGGRGRGPDNRKGWLAYFAVGGRPSASNLAKMTDQRRGTLYAICAYGLWGLLPLYLLLLRPAGSLEVLGHRMVWSLVLLLGLLAVLRRWSWLRAGLRRPRVLGGLAAAAVLVAVNWGTYIYGVNAGRVVEVSLGYFINPLVSVLLGVLILRERLRPGQWMAVGVGTAAVAVLAVNYGRMPWLAITVAVSFGLYGLVKKFVGAPAVEGMTIETGIQFLPAVVFLGWLEASGGAAFGTVSIANTLLLIGCGVITAVPLLLFAGAANRVSLTVLGMCQYLAPSLQFLIGVLLLHEPMPGLRLVGFGLVWLALVIFTLDAVRHNRRTGAPTQQLAAGRSGQPPVTGGEPAASR